MNIEDFLIILYTFKHLLKMAFIIGVSWLIAAGIIWFLELLLEIEAGLAFVCFIILALIWLDKVSVPIFITMLMVMPVVWANVTSSIVNTDKSLIEMANAYNFGLAKKLKLIFLPSAVPAFVSAF